MTQIFSQLLPDSAQEGNQARAAEGGRRERERERESSTGNNSENSKA